MSRGMPPRTTGYGGPSLPRSLLDQVGAPAATKRKGAFSRRPPPNRKDQRKLERQRKPQQSKPRHAQVDYESQRSQQPHRDEDEDEDEASSGDDVQDFSPPPQKHAIVNQKPTATKVGSQLKSILKKPSTDRPKKEITATMTVNTETRPLSRREKEKLAQDDADIAALEKKLGIKGKKSKALQDDGLAELFGEFDDDDDLELGKRKREDKAWLDRKRRKVEEISSGSEDEEVDDMEDDTESEHGFEGIDQGEDDGDLSLSDDSDRAFKDDDPDFETAVDDDETLNGPPYSRPQGFPSDARTEKPRVRENPYVAPAPTDGTVVAKYIPPSLRAASATDEEQLVRLHRQTQGLLNRLSEANLTSILVEVEKLYQNNARQHVTSTLIDLLLGLICDRAALLDTFIILHAGFIAALYKIIGPDFGAQMLERIVDRFDHYYYDANEDGKEALNMASLLAQLYNLQVIGSELVFDYMRHFLQHFTEIDTELILRFVRSSGYQLRQDDPSSLKDIVVLLHSSVASHGAQASSVRTKFMIETINDLKNNKLKAGVAASATTSEHLSRMRKILGAMNSRNVRASEPLRVGLRDIRNTEKRGKWWLVGASWKGKNESVEDESDSPHKPDNKSTTTSNGFEAANDDDIDLDPSADLLTLARHARMNTDIRRAIFITLMSSSDYKDAHLRLLKLNLTRSQEVEIPRVLLHCAGAEQVYNPFYTVIARRLCGEHKLRVAFRFALWDLFKRMGEKGENDDEIATRDEDDEEKIGMTDIVNHAKLYGDLIANGCLDLKVLKNLDFVYLQPRTKVFAEILFITAILQCGKQRERRTQSATTMLNLQGLFEPTLELPHLAAGLRYFLRKVVAKTDLAKAGKDEQRLRDGCAHAVALLAASRTTGVSLDD